MAKNAGFVVDNFLKVAPQATHTVLEDFEQKKRSQTDFKVRFTMADRDNNMSYSVRDGGTEYRVVMPAEELAGTSVKNIRRMVDLEKEYLVRVIDIDYATNKIVVSHQQAMTTAREDLVKDIVKGIADNDFVRTKAVIEYIRTGSKGQHFLELDIGGVGLKGLLFKDEWSKCYTSDIRSFAKVGDIIDVEITGVLAPKNYQVGSEITTSSKKVIFRCSRKNTIDFEPWEGVGEKYPVGTTVNIVCIHKEQSRFFARVEGLDELNALCVYPDTEEFYIREGGRYRAYVKKVIEEEKVLILKPVKELE